MGLVTQTIAAAAVPQCAVTQPASQCMRELCETFSGSQVVALQRVKFERNRQIPGLLASRQAELGVHSGELSEAAHDELSKAFGGPDNLRTMEFGRYTVVIVVNRLVSKRSITVEELRDLLTGEITNWKQIGGEDRPVVVVGPDAWSNAGYVLGKSCLQGSSLTPRLVLRKRAAEVDKTVAETAGAIGFRLHDWRDPRDVVAVRIGRKDEETHLPTPESVSTGQYPLTRPVLLVGREEVFERSREFLDFLVGDEAAAKICRKHSLFPEYERQKVLSELRLLAAKKGEGPRASAH